MTLDPQVEELRRRRVAEGAHPLYTLSLDAARAADLEAIRAGAGAGQPVWQVEEIEMPGPDGPLPGRVYRPSSERPLPVLLYFFGGGWTLGTIDTCDAVCRALTQAAGCVTVSVGYRLAPEHKFPAAVLDCAAALDWVVEHARELGVDVRRLTVAGDSAGGNLAAAVTLLCRDRGGPEVRAQVLVYPNTCYQADTESMGENTDPAFFNSTSVAWYWNHYLATPEDGLDPLASPLRAPDLAGLPPALVITAEHDPLRDEGEQYAHRLASAGVPVELRRFDGMVHGFFTMLDVLDSSRRAVAEVAEFLRKHYEA